MAEKGFMFTSKKIGRDCSRPFQRNHLRLDDFATAWRIFTNVLLQLTDRELVEVAAVTTSPLRHHAGVDRVGQQVLRVVNDLDRGSLTVLVEHEERVVGQSGSPTDATLLEVGAGSSLGVANHTFLGHLGSFHSFRCHYIISSAIKAHMYKCCFELHCIIVVRGMFLKYILQSRGMVY